ncbi:MAG: DNA double-strand break repair nuclease NurA [Gammaproteobacteria bacterium]|nr:DNA double-strand break repair nuclease NurA [Gammaproteobacteria bacterium]
MPYKKETASGDSLIWLENSSSLKDFQGEIRHKDKAYFVPPEIKVRRENWWPRRVIAVDGSNIVTRVNNGFPGAEAGLLMISVVAIKLDLLQKIEPGSIPSPSIFHDMENALTVDAPLPGIGIVRKKVDDDEPVNFFRETVLEILSSTLADDHESLLGTLRAISQDFEPKKCPIVDCDRPYTPGKGKYLCNCEKKEYLFETDILRLHEYFDGISASGEAHGRLRAVLEILVLLNILRFFAKKCPAYLKDCAFVLDGPLAVFGTPASMLRPIQKELLRLNTIARQSNGTDIVLFGIQKTGMFVEHWEQIDWDDDKGPRTRFADGTVIAPDGEYIRNNILPGKAGKNFGTDTYFGRTVMYKTNKGEHTVLNTAMLNEQSRNTENNAVECYPRLGDILNVMDQMATYLYRDGFLPLVRAHAHAAIPLKRGSDIIKTLLET